jgi:hypothetical protein
LGPFLLDPDRRTLFRQGELVTVGQRGIRLLMAFIGHAGDVLSKESSWTRRGLAYYVEAWRELMFVDPDQDAKKTRDPVAPATRSKTAEIKVTSRQLDDGTPAHSFSTLLGELGTIVRNTCRTPMPA